MEAFRQLLDTAYPRLATRASLRTDKTSGEPILLFPEGIVLLNEPSAAITSLCDGTRSFSDILGRLAEQFQSSPDELSEDVCEFLFNLHQQNLLDFTDQEGKK
jgi:pyrroloquinoline quinone biosynthesis protein D